MSTKEEVKTVDKATKIKELRSYHQPVFDAVGGNPLYCPKMFYTPAGKNELYVSFFISEVQRGQDIYTEMVDREFNSEDPARTLYKWSFNEFWDSEYEKTTTNPVRVLVPMKELTKVNAIIPLEEDFSDCADGDCPLSEMTIRDIAAIISWKPVSRKKWLNDLINTRG